MSAGNKNKKQGTTEEKRQRDRLLSYGFKVDRLAEEGIYDKGDYVIRLPVDVVGESKHAGALNIHEVVAKAKKKAGSGVYSFVWWKRSKRKGGNQKRSMVGKPIVCVDEEVFMALLAWAGQAMELQQIGDKD